MSVAVTKAGPYYASGQIKFSSLRSNFRAQVRKETSGGSETFNTDNAAIKASELLRNITNTNTNPVVPNATENSSIATSSNWKSSQFRNSIKYYYITQSGTDTNLDIDAQSWNTNLTNNTVKVAFIDGTCGSSSVNSVAADFNATAYNLTIDVYGNIFGCGGRGGGTTGAPDPSGEAGGDALGMASSGGNNVNVLVRSSGKIYGGGGGGERGAKGANGSGGRCREETIQQNCGSDPGCPGGFSSQGSWGGRCCASRCGSPCWSCCEQCTANIRYTRCVKEYNTSGGTGGVGGTGGPGRGYNNQSGSLSGAAGAGGSGGGGCGATSGATGETGGAGGDWASAGGNTNNSGSGGANGRAITGSNYSVSGTINSSTVKGAYRP